MIRASLALALLAASTATAAQDNRIVERFYDAGKVTAARRDLNLSGLRRSYGIGIRFHAPAATVLRAELARTDEGFGLVLAFSPAF